MKPTSYLNHHNKIVRHEGSVYTILATTLGPKVLVGADCTLGPNRGTYVDLLKSRSPLSAAIRNLIGLNLVS
jgi:hypothetical protein